MEEEMNANMLGETENYMIWTSESDDETLYHIELGGISLHLTGEDWDELVTLIKLAAEV
ncbi:MAG: hypothetical protein JXA42_10785 [Anaerolineales bacterium]|nr:hypothetical protein [Anaerolineales bacterium]